MIGQYLPQTNESATVAKSNFFSHLNKAGVRPSNTFKEENMNIYIYLMLKGRLFFSICLFLLLVMSSRPPYSVCEPDSGLVLIHIVQFQDGSNDSTEFDAKTLEQITIV
jgi:hypothetical protein